ncbi:MAG: citrate synthase [Nitrososphaerota archaeon]|nr:citrate synthase [Nitrososphaerota archaeon]MDG7014611.1 citrate synthase [Nitrososphaerota archaeon]
MTEPLEAVKVPRGLAGVSVADTRISKSSADGSLVYRGYPIADLAANASFEETAYLVLNGKLPTRGELDSFASGIARRSSLDRRVFDIMGALGGGAHPIDAIRTGVSALGSIDAEQSIQDKEASIESKMPVLAANCLRVPKGEPPRLPGKTGGFADRLLQMLTPREASEFDRWVFERVLIFYMEHDMNASSFTVRVVASTLADPYAAASAGLASLKGPLHGGANEAAMEMLLRAKDPENAGPFVEATFREGRKLMGFGHRVYKQFDPRARLCKEYLGEMTKKRGDDRIYRLCDAIEREMWEKKKIPPNLDYYAAPIFYLLGIEVPLYTPIFAASRVFGWMAHYNEQVEENKLIRPDSTYVGHAGRSYVPIEKR